MKTEVFEARTRIPAPAAAVFAWHERPAALRELIPPGAPIRIVSRTGGIRDGAVVILRVGFGIFSIRWVARHLDYIEGVEFTDVQERGPFAYWRHTHRFQPDGAGACILHDHVEYALPFGVRSIARGLVRRQLQRTFEYRHRTTFEAFC